MSMQNHVGRRLEPDVASTRSWLEDLFESTEPNVQVVSTLHTGMSLEFRESDVLPIEAEFSSLGRGLGEKKLCLSKQSHG